MSQARALIIDDEADIQELLDITLSRMDISTQAAGTLSQAQYYLQQGRFNFCLLDMHLPDGDGLSLLPLIQEIDAALPVIVITAHGNTDLAVKAMKLGAFDFLSKPVDLKNLRLLIQSALNANYSPKKERRMRHILLGESEIMCTLRGKIVKIARNQAPVYIRGESGTGKELVARLIHQQSARADFPFIAVNCGAIPHELMESEFFGHKKGSYTGAISDKEGLFQAAKGGSLFLDEIADLPLMLQVKLLRAVQEKKVRAIGSSTEEAVDIRLISATHKDLAQLVQEGLFRQDLYYRINVIELALPALRERAEDIPQLAEFFIQKISQTNQMTETHLDLDAITALKQYYFSGNVRELENILERSLAFHESGNITAQDLNLIATQAPHNSLGYPVHEGSLEDYLTAIEKQAITCALEQNQWNQSLAAEQLGMSFRSLRYRLKKLGLDL